MNDPVAALADEIGPELRSAFLDCVETLSDHVDAPALVAAVESGDDETVLGYVIGHFRPLQELIEDAFDRAGTVAAGVLGLTFAAAISATSSARVSLAHGIVRGIARDTARALIEAVRSDLRTDPAARVRDAIGLTPAQAGSVAAVRAVLEDALERQTRRDAFARAGFARVRAAVAKLPGHLMRRLSAPQLSMIEKATAATLDQDRVDALVARQRRAMVKVRADAIGITEATRITNAAEQEAWRQASARGDLSPTVRRHWQDVGDERVRHAHAAVSGLNPDGVAIDEPFATPLGPCMGPPLEVNCRCRVVLREVA